jgi:hypothetical protein
VEEALPEILHFEQQACRKEGNPPSSSSTCSLVQGQPSHWCPSSGVLRKPRRSLPCALVAWQGRQEVASQLGRRREPKGTEGRKRCGTRRVKPLRRRPVKEGGAGECVREEGVRERREGGAAWAQFNFSSGLMLPSPCWYGPGMREAETRHNPLCFKLGQAQTHSGSNR